MSGGFQDAYTYNVRKEVFSNAQTGNIVLMSQHIMMGELMKGLSYLFPVVAFALGVLVAERIGHRYKGAKRIHWRQIIVAIEIVILFAVGFIPERYDMLATMLVSFFMFYAGSGIQKSKWLWICKHNVYRKSAEWNGKPFNIFERKTAWSTKKAAHYYGIIFIFAIGAGVGGICSLHIGIRAIWILKYTACNSMCDDD